MDKKRRFVRLAVIGLCLALPWRALAQSEATVRGTVRDESGAVLPGVTVTSTEINTGRQYAAVTDSSGEYRLPNVLPGTYKLQAELEGFATAVVPSLELLVGQNASVPFVLRISTLSETVTITGDSPLVDVSSATVSSNIDRRQMELLPLQGRNWVELTLMVRGVTVNDVGNNRPGTTRDEDFQLNLDGQQITYRFGGSAFGQPKFSREVIAEFQVSTTLFDITEGRSTGLQVQAISRSGTNELRGSAYGYFRDSKFQAADFVAGRVLPYQNQQMGGTLGGPFVRDKLHYFGSYEFEREPQTLFIQPQGFNQSYSFANTNKQHSLLARVDQQLGSDHLSYRASYWRFNAPFELGSTAFPSQAFTRTRTSGTVLGTWTRVLNDENVQEVRIGFARYAHPTDLVYSALLNTPNYAFPNITIGTPNNFPQTPWEHNYSARYDLNSHRGKHDFKLGAELVVVQEGGEWSLNGRGTFTLTRSLPPAEMERRFPTYDSPATWDLSGLDPLVSDFTQNVGNFDQGGIVNPNVAIWIGDIWRLSNKLTVNYGVRWDDAIGFLNPPDVTNRTMFAPFGAPLFTIGLSDHNNIAPRVGFTYAVTDRNDLIIRGGAGLYYSAPVGDMALFQMAFGNRLKANTFVNDGAPGFIANPTRNFTAQEIASGTAPQAPSPIGSDYQLPSSLQSTISVQKQFGPVTGVDVALTHSRTRHLTRTRDINLAYDPVTGYNVDPIRVGRPDPVWGQINWRESTGKADALMLTSSVNRRLSNNFQSSVNYTQTFYKRDNTSSLFFLADNQFNPDDEWAPASDYQRHTLRANLIAKLPMGFSLSGNYFFGSGSRFATVIAGRPFNKPGANRLNTSAPLAIPDSVADRFDGPAVIGTNTTVPRNALIGLPIHKVDVRVTKDLPLGGARRLSLIAEMFNAFNHANYGSYNTQLNSTTFGNAVQNLATTYSPRAGQFGLRLQF